MQRLGWSKRPKSVHELQAAAAVGQMGLVQVSEQDIQVTPTGWFFVRAVAMVFDKHLQSDQMRARFSHII